MYAPFAFDAIFDFVASGLGMAALAAMLTRNRFQGPGMRRRIQAAKPVVREVALILLPRPRMHLLASSGRAFSVDLFDP